MPLLLDEMGGTVHRSTGKDAKVEACVLTKQADRSTGSVAPGTWKARIHIASCSDHRHDDQSRVKFAKGKGEGQMEKGPWSPARRPRTVRR
jgi:hypothetical protein